MPELLYFLVKQPQSVECIAHFCIHRLESIVDWRWPLPCAHSVMMVFSTQLADGGGPCPPPLTLSTTSTRVTSELCTQINCPSPIFCGCDNKLAGTVSIVWIITHRWKFHKEPTQRCMIATFESTQRYQGHSWADSFYTGTGVGILYEKIIKIKKLLILSVSSVLRTR